MITSAQRARHSTNCGHSWRGRAGQSASRLPVALTLATAVALGSCGGEPAATSGANGSAQPAPAPAPAPAPTPSPAPQSDTPTAEQMEHHFEEATRTRDALVRGDLDAARAAARTLAETGATADMPSIWRPYFAQMQQASRRVADATDLDGAAAAFGDVARACGTCHSSVGAEITVRATPPPSGDDVVTHMRRHQWATDRIWEGIVIPSDELFTTGAGALAEAPLHPSGILPEQTAGPEIQAISERVHELGRNASRATDDALHAQLYGEMLRTCADCHRRAGAEL